VKRMRKSLSISRRRLDFAEGLEFDRGGALGGGLVGPQARLAFRGLQQPESDGDLPRRPAVVSAIFISGSNRHFTMAVLRVAWYARNGETYWNWFRSWTL